MKIPSAVLILTILLVQMLHTSTTAQRAGSFNALLRSRAREIIRQNRVAARIGLNRLVVLQRIVSRRGSCNVRLCFALDGSSPLSRNDYELQKDMTNVLASVAAIDRASFSAVQYGLVNQAISSRTQNVRTFRSRVERSSFAGASSTFVGAGLGFCISNVKRGNAGDGRKIVVFGSGQPGLGDAFLPNVLSAVKDEEIFAIGVGRRVNTSKLRQIALGKGRNVFVVRGRAASPEKVVENVLFRICSV